MKRENIMTAIIFDLDGTLLDSLKDLGSAMNTTLKEYGYPEHPMESYKTFVGNGLYKLCQRALGKNQENFDAVFESFLKQYGEQDSVAEVYPNVLETLKELNALNIPIGIHTNKMQRFTDEIVETFFGDIKFEMVVGDREDDLKKPNPHYTHEIIKSFPGNTESVYFVGDSDVDMFTAVNAKVIPVGVSWGFRSVEQLQGAGAQYVIDNMKDLLNVIK